MALTLQDANTALRYIDWSEVHAVPEGTKIAVIIDGEPVTATVVQSVKQNDESHDRDIFVTIEIAGQFWQKQGYASVGSHCYGDYEDSWYELREVAPREKTVTEYVPV
jgi:hypothetical protein